MIPTSDKQVLRELAQRMSEIAALPIHGQRREMMSRIDDLRPAKPCVFIYQEPWNELNVNDELTLRTSGPLCRGLETHLRQTLYKWDHMQADMVVDNAIYFLPRIVDTGFGIGMEADVVKTDAANDVVSRRFHVQISREADVDKIKMPQVSRNEDLDRREYEQVCEIFDGVIPVKRGGYGPFWFAPWDDIVQWTGVEDVLMDMAERPDYVHKLIDRMVTAWLCRLDQYDRLGLLAKPPAQEWASGAAQIFAAVSPAMHEEFALKHEARWYERFKLSYYGCCKPLHHKVDIVRRNIPRLRKISMSPWVDFPQAIQNVGKQLVFCWKPNPAVLAADRWDPQAVRKDMEEKLHLARECIVEVHMKDISTVRYQPQRLWEWAKIAREVTAKFT
jgi:hypothetical protein